MWQMLKFLPDECISFRTKIVIERNEIMKKIYVGITILILIVGGVIMFYDKDDNGNKATIKYVSMNEIQKIMDK